MFFHAHPDDEALLTAGTMARAAAEGNRVVLLTATAGEEGLADAALQPGLGALRSVELQTSARILGVARLELLGYADSGLHGDAHHTGATTFCEARTQEIADRVAAIVRQEHACSLVIYDQSGGYGHPDHVRVHQSGLMAAEQLPGVTVYAATAPREPFAWGVRAAGKVMTFPPDFDPLQFETAFTPHRQITHRVDVRDYADFKRAAMHAHGSQATGGDVRTLGALLKLPRPVFRIALGVEYYRRLA